ELDFALFVGQAAVADGVIVGVVLDDGDGGNDGVKRVAAFFEDVHAAAERVDAVGAGDDERALALRGGHGDARTIACCRGGWRWAAEEAGYAGGAAGERGKKEFTA